MEAGDPRARMRAVAAEIAAARPDLAGLQEAALWRSQPRDGARASSTTSWGSSSTELRARGAEYAVAATASAVDVALPGAAAVYRFTDRDVVLARAGLQTANARGGTYEARLPPRSPAAGPPGVAREWTSVDVELGGRTLRFVSTHPRR